MKREVQIDPTEKTILKRLSLIKVKENCATFLESNKSLDDVLAFHSSELDQMRTSNCWGFTSKK